MQKIPLIDVHQHALPDAYRKYIIANNIRTSMGGQLSEWAPERNLELMGRASIGAKTYKRAFPGRA